jgi:hypothetical protein
MAALVVTVLVGTLAVSSSASASASPLPPAAAQWDFAARNKPLCDTVSGACLTQHNASDPVATVAGAGAVFGPERAQRIAAPRSSVPRLTAIAGPNATVSVVAWLRPAPGYTRGGFVGGLWDEGDAARQYALYMGPMARCETPEGVVGHISADGGPPADIGHLACESAACGSTSLAAVAASWHCVSITYDGASIRAYLNGSLDDWLHPRFNGSDLNPFRYPEPPTFPLGGIFAPPAGHPAADIAFGANFINHGHGKVLSSGGFRGTLHGYAVWGDALAPVQIKQACEMMRPFKADDDVAQAQIQRPTDPWFPAFHPRMHTAHNNDPAGCFFYKGVYHLFMQQEFTWSPYCKEQALGKGCHGWGHMASTDAIHWREISTATGFDDAFVPGRWVDREFGAVRSYYTGSVTVVDGVPHALVPAVFVKPSAACIAAGSTVQGCNFEYQLSTPLNLSDPWLASWSQPRTIARSSQGPQPHTGTWQDPTGV